MSNLVGRLPILLNRHSYTHTGRSTEGRQEDAPINPLLCYSLNDFPEKVTLLKPVPPMKQDTSKFIFITTDGSGNLHKEIVNRSGRCGFDCQETKPGQLDGSSASSISKMGPGCPNSKMSVAMPSCVSVSEEALCDQDQLFYCFSCCLQITQTFPGF